jgi:hypothetical protein
MSILPKPLPPLELLQELFYVSETSPSGLRWKNPRVGRIKPGDIAGTKERNGYWRLNITTDKPRFYRAHRIIVYLQTKEDPGIKFVDHINGLSDPLNLRLANNSENSYNQSKRGNRSSIYKGVCWDKSRNKWLANITKDNKTIYLGRFNTEKDAANAYNMAAINLFGEFIKLNAIN